MPPLRDASGRFVAGSGSSGSSRSVAGGGGLAGVKVRTRIDVRKVLRAKERASQRTIYQAAGYVRTTMRRKIGKTRKPRAPGKPMSSPTGAAKRAVLYTVDRTRESAIIGPRYSIVGRSARAHEHGLKIRREKFPKRPFAQPSLVAAAPKLGPMWRGAIR